MTPQTLSLTDLKAMDAHPMRSGQNTRYLCIFCGDAKPRDNEHRSLSVHDTGFWHCHRCDAKGKLVEFREEAARPVYMSSRNRMRAEIARKSAITTPRAAPAPDEESERVWREAYVQAVDIRGTPGASYLEGRGLSVDAAEAAGVRFSPNWKGRPGVIFALFDIKGGLSAVQVRYIDDQKIGHNTAGQKSQGMFATCAQAWNAQSMIIAEAPIDALSLHLAGHPCLAICGKDVRQWVVDGCTGRRVVIALDNDLNEAGQKAADSWIDALHAVGAHPILLSPPTDQDWNALLQSIGPKRLGKEVAKVLKKCEEENPHLARPIGPFKRNIEAWPERTQALFDPEGDSPEAVYVSRIPTTYFPIRIFATETEALAWVRPGRIYLVRPEWLRNGVETLP